MALQTTTNINIDFYDKKYILINAKQLDKGSRFLSVTCYNHGEPYLLNSSEHSVYIRYKKSDNNSVFNFCNIDKNGKIIVELTEQMLIVDGICYADLVIVNKGSAKVDSETGEIIAIDNTSILSTMPLHIDVTEVPFMNSDVESSYAYDGLNVLLERAEAYYEDVILTSKSWAVGDTGIRDGENTDNAKYYSQQSSNSADLSSASALNAANSEKLAKEHMDNALVYSQNSQTYMDNANTYMDNASKSATNALNSEQNAKTSEEKAHDSEQNAKASEENAKVSETNAKTSETNAKISESNAQSYMSNAESYMNNAKTSEDNAKISEANAANSEENAQIYMDEAYVSEQNAKASEDNAKVSEANAKECMDSSKISEENALNSANLAKSYAIGGTDTRFNEDNDNANYYYNLTKNIVVGLDSGFIPMGTIAFDELKSAEKKTGYVYNIKDNFVTDNTFREGEGKQYAAGTNVYYTADGHWDCFGVTAPTATIDEVKEYLGIE